MGKKPIILALDQGTSSSRSLLVDEHLQVIAQSSLPVASHYPHPGWVEQSPQELWQTQWKTVQLVLEQARLSLSQITCIGIANQRETTLGWDKQTGEPLGPAIVWQCRRTTELCESMKAQGLEPLYRQKTGLRLDPYFSGSKMAWILEHHPKAKDLAAQGRLALGTVDSWLLFKLTGGKAHVTDSSNASRTLLYNLHTSSWDEELSRPWGIPLDALPQVKESSGLFGWTDPSLGAKIPITGLAGDQQAALFGQGCFEVGQAKNTYGTGCFMLANTGEQPVFSSHGLLSTVAWTLGGKTTYALEGSVFVGGSLIQWLRDQLGLIKQAQDTEAMAMAVKDNAGVYLVPAFVGLGAPHWDPYARGVLVGLTHQTTKNHIARAALEAIAFQSAELAVAMSKDLGGPLRELHVDGGASANRFLCQFQADLLGYEVLRPAQLESTALGAAMLAGLGAGVWSGLDELKQKIQLKDRFQPSPIDTQTLWEGWTKAVGRAKGWAT